MGTRTAILASSRPVDKPKVLAPQLTPVLAALLFRLAEPPFTTIHRFGGDTPGRGAALVARAETAAVAANGPDGHAVAAAYFLVDVEALRAGADAVSGAVINAAAAEAVRVARLFGLTPAAAGPLAAAEGAVSDATSVAGLVDEGSTIAGGGGVVSEGDEG